MLIFRRKICASFSGVAEVRRYVGWMEYVCCVHHKSAGRQFPATASVGRRTISLKSFVWTITLHLFALFSAPKAYVVAIFWRLCGKKVRSRHQLNTIFGSSRYAYKYWMERHRYDDTAPPTKEGTPTIIALIDRGIDVPDHLLSEALRRLKAEAVQTILVGPPAAGRFEQVISQIDWSSSPWILPITAGDRIHDIAIRCYQRAIVKAPRDAEVLYADDDHLDRWGGRENPHFKPQWNSELFRHFDYVTKSSVLHVQAEDFAGLDDVVDWSRALTTRLLERSEAVHVPYVLHHRHNRPCPIIPAWTEAEDDIYPLVSVLIPTRNRVELLRTCVEGVLATDYPAIEVIIIDNDSDDAATCQYLEDVKQHGVRVLHHAGQFNFSTLNNLAAQKAKGEMLCLLNNDIEIMEPNWLKAMVAQAQRPEVGAVGAQLLYPDGRIQHAGVVVGVGNAAGHAHKLLRPSDRGYFSRHNLPQFVSAVTAACLVVAKERYLAVGGLDEGHFAVAFNDVDFCLKLNTQGWQSLYEPRAVLIHHESVSRGFDRDPVGAKRFSSELNALQTRWQTDQVVDPYHHPMLSRSCEQFVLEM